MSFKMAGSLAFKDGMSRARPTILEPVMTVEIYAPSDYAGDLMGDLNGRRGRISGMDTRGATTVIRAQVPMSEMLTYEQQLTSATGGRGSFTWIPHYEEVPSHQQQKIIAAAKAERAGVEVEECSPKGRGPGAQAPDPCYFSKRRYPRSPSPWSGGNRHSRPRRSPRVSCFMTSFGSTRVSVTHDGCANFLRGTR